MFQTFNHYANVPLKNIYYVKALLSHVVDCMKQGVKDHKESSLIK